MYEHRRARLLPLRAFVWRVAIHAVVGSGLVFVSLLCGMWGYAHFEHLPWLDAFLNAAMLLGGMGPVESPRTASGKLFAGLYALYAGMVFLIAVGVVLAPLIHRVLHRFHLAEADDAPHGPDVEQRDRPKG
jgi:hypothetical protein